MWEGTNWTQSVTKTKTNKETKDMKLRNINVSETVWESQTEGIRVQHDQYALNYLVWNFHKNF